MRRNAPELEFRVFYLWDFGVAPRHGVCGRRPDGGERPDVGRLDSEYASEHFNHGRFGSGTCVGRRVGLFDVGVSEGVKGLLGEGRSGSEFGVRGSGVPVGSAGRPEDEEDDGSWPSRGPRIE